MPNLFKISYSRKKTKKQYIKTNKDAYIFAKACFDNDTIQWHETSIIICLNNDASIIGWYKIGDGGLDCCIAHKQKIYQVALLSNCASFILAHNHPSGRRAQSKSDKKIKREISKGTELLGLQLLDSLIITP